MDDDVDVVVVVVAEDSFVGLVIVVFESEFRFDDDSEPCGAALFGIVEVVVVVGEENDVVNCCFV